MNASRRLVLAGLLSYTLVATSGAFGTQKFDVLITNGTIVDGSGHKPFVGDVAIRGDRIVKIGDLHTATAGTIVDARGLTVAPGFINSFSWGTQSLLQDARAQSDVRQGVTLEILSEGTSPGPLNEEMRHSNAKAYGFSDQVPWKTLGGYLDFVQSKGTSVNFTSYIGATTVREYVLGGQSRAPTAQELHQMSALVEESMREGAVGVSSALIYVPGNYAGTDELVALARAAGKYGGTYTSHIRSEGNKLLEGIDEFIAIVRRSGAAGELNHLKAAGTANWGKMDAAIARLEEARAAGLRLNANMYTFEAGATGLTACVPRWVQKGGLAAWTGQLQEPQVRSRLVLEMREDSDDWENLLRLSGAQGVVPVSFQNPTLRKYAGRSIAAIAAERNSSPEETVLDLLSMDGGPIFTAYHFISEDNIRKEIRLPWISFGSDGDTGPEGDFPQNYPNPRAYGTFAKVWGDYVREQKVITLEDAARRLAYLPAQIHHLRDRGLLRAGYFADIAVFDSARIANHATYDNPHQYATGMRYVLVNGVMVLRDGEHTGARPGRIVRGPGWRKH